MIVLLGANGYLGSAFAMEMLRRQWTFIPVTRRILDFSKFDTLSHFLRGANASFVINAAGYTGKPNVDECETKRAETLAGNTLLPQTVAHACAAKKIPWCHVSSGCIYDQIKSNHLYEFTETDTPNFTFRNERCSFYSGTKALAEEAIAGIGESYILRLRIPFDEYDGPRNYLTKLQRYPKLYQNLNSLTHRREFVSAALDLWAKRAPFGIYNLTNPGSITTREVVHLIKSHLDPSKLFEFWRNDEEFYRLAAIAPRSNCVLDTSKLRETGIIMRPVRDALEASLKNWVTEL